MRPRAPSWQTLTHRGRPYRRLPHPTPHYTLAVYEPLGAVEPDRPCAVFIHGLEDGWETWDPLVARLRPRVRSFCLDLPWSGRNRYDWAHETSVAEWVSLGLDLLPEPASIVVAHSFGANALLEHLDRHGPGAIEAVVLLSPFYRGRDAFPWPVFFHYLDSFERFLQAGVQVRRPPRRSTPESDRELARKVFEHIGPDGCLQFLNLFARTPRLDLGRLPVPVLVLGGEEDFYSLPADCESLTRALPRSEARLLRRCGHFSMIEQPETLSSVILEFLSRSLEPRLRERGEDRPCPSP